MTNAPHVQIDEDRGPLLIHIGKAAERLGLSRYQVKKLIDAGQLPSEPVGKRIYIPAAALDKYDGTAP